MAKNAAYPRSSKTGEADDDVEAEGEGGIRSGVGSSVYVGVVIVHQGETSTAMMATSSVSSCWRRTKGRRAASVMRHLRTYSGRRGPAGRQGRKTSTSTRIEKMITSVQAVAMNCPPMASIRPMMTPPSIAPGTLPIPPRTAAVKARSQR